MSFSINYMTVSSKQRNHLAQALSVLVLISSVHGDLG